MSKCLKDEKCLGYFHIPLHFELGVNKKRKYALNLNTYRNLHHHVNSDLKIKVSEYVKEFALILPIHEPVEIEYIIYPGSKRRMDLDNMMVIAKYIQDALVSAGILEDDDYKHITKISFTVGDLDPNKKGYAEVYLYKKV